VTPAAIDAVLADFRAWLEQAAEASASPEPEAPAPAFSWHALAAEFTALRHEVKLQTRAARAQLEQGAEALRHLAESEQAAATAEEEASEEALRPVLQALT